MTGIRCNKCHRYLEGAPDPSLDHEESPGDARCTLEHHPNPCDYKSNKYGDCTAYSTGTIPKDAVAAQHNITEADLAKKFDALDSLTAKSGVMEGNLAKVEGSIGQLSSEMAVVIKMLGDLSKSGPSPTASLADNFQSETPQNTTTQAAASHLPQTASISGQSGLQSEAAAYPMGNLDHATISSYANDLVSNNLPKESPKIQVPGYTGQTLPEMRKDQALSDLVRSELHNILSSMPSLQKAPDANTNTTQGGPMMQQSIHDQQTLARQQLLKFQSTQQEQLQKFAADQKAQFEALQEKLGVLVSPPYLPAQSLQPTVTHAALTPAVDTHHPAYLALGGQQGQQADQPQAGALAMDMETLLGLTVRTKQFRPYEFAKRTQLFYASSINERNCNFPCYILGYLRHCLILMSGVVPSTENEVSSRLTNLMNICEIAANNSNLTDFDCPGWQIGKAYGDRVFHDMESGRRSWEDLPAHILPDIFLHAKDTVAMRASKNRKPENEDKKKAKKKGEATKACSTYNTFRTGDGCAYEWSNSDKKCEFEHYCKKCHQKSGKKERHKALNCDAEADPPKKED